MNRPDLAGSALVVVAAAGYGTLGALSRLAGEAGVGVLGFVAWRGLLGALFIIVPLFAAARLGRARLVPLSSVPGLERGQLVIAAAFSMATNLAIFAAFERTTIALVLICFYTYPVLVAVTGVLRYGERLDRVRATALGLASAGMLLVVAAPMAGQPGMTMDGLGVALGLTAAVLQAAYAVITGRGFASVPPAVAAGVLTAVTAALTVSVAVLAGAGALLLEPLSDPAAWPWLLAAGTIGSAIPTVAVVAGFRRVGPTRASIIMLLEPVVAVSLAGLLLAERPAGLQLVGGLLVLGGAAVLQVAPTRAQIAAEGPPSV